MSKQAKQTKIKLADGVVHAEESMVHDNSLLPMADELERLVAINAELLDWLKKRAEIEQDTRIDFNTNRIQEYRDQGRRTFIFNMTSLFMAFAIVVGGGTASVLLALKGSSIEGSILGGVTLVAAAGVFLRRNRNANEKEMNGF